MSFYMGQRVRINAPAARFFHGLEATVQGANVRATFADFTGYALHVDGIGTQYSGHRIVAPANELVPITPPGMESLAETLALWEPVGEHA